MTECRNCKDKCLRVEFNFSILTPSIMRITNVFELSNWEPPEETQRKDKRKIDFCIANNVSVVRILQEDIYNNNYNWESELKKYISHLEDHSDDVFIKFLDEDDTYSDKYFADDYLNYNLVL
jgi:hypothetical protein